MAEENESEESTAEEALEGLDLEEDAPPKGKKKLIIIILLLLIIGGGTGAGLYFGGIIGGSGASEDEAMVESEEDDTEYDEDGKPINVGPFFFEMEEFIINLNTGGKQVNFLKMKIMLELDKQGSIATIESKLPIIRDSFQVYLRELRSEDLQGSAGIFRLKSELLLRINKLLYPVEVDNILFKDILIQ